MGYLIKIQMRDTELEYPDKATRDRDYKSLLKKFTDAKIPADNVVIQSIDTQVSSFSGQEERKINDQIGV